MHKDQRIFIFFIVILWLRLCLCRALDLVHLRLCCNLIYKCQNMAQGLSIVTMLVTPSLMQCYGHKAFLCWHSLFCLGDFFLSG